MKSVTIPSVGTIESPWKSVDDLCDYRGESRIVLDPEWLHALTGVEYFSHLWVIYHQNRASEWLRAKGLGEMPPQTFPLGDERAGQGIFSARAPGRPAGLGSCIVELVCRMGTTLVVRGLDALDGTPVLDLKPYVPQFDAFPDAVIPLDWSCVLARHDDASRGSRVFHWDTTGPAFALGLRAGLSALARLGSGRCAPELGAKVVGSLFFAQGWELATGCRVLNGTLAWTDCAASSTWSARLEHADGRSAEFSINPSAWADAPAVMNASDDRLFTRTIISPALAESEQLKQTT